MREPQVVVALEFHKSRLFPHTSILDLRHLRECHNHILSIYGEPLLTLSLQHRHSFTRSDELARHGAPTGLSDQVILSSLRVAKSPMSDKGNSSVTINRGPYLIDDEGYTLQING
jgi:hypothetical protein